MKPKFPVGTEVIALSNNSDKLIKGIIVGLYFYLEDGIWNHSYDVSYEQVNNGAAIEDLITRSTSRFDESKILASLSNYPNGAPVTGYIYPDGSFKPVRPYDGEMFDMPDPGANSYTTYMWDDQSGNWIFYGQTPGSHNLGNTVPNPKPYTNPDGTFRSMRPTPKERYQIPHPWSPNPIVYEWDDSKDLWVDVTVYTHSNPPPVGNMPSNTGTYSYQVDLVHEFDKLIEQSKEKTCECGSETVGSPNHSSWCPKHD